MIVHSTIPALVRVFRAQLGPDARLAAVSAALVTCALLRLLA